jgi:Arc/MetJ family transcription regulator
MVVRTQITLDAEVHRRAKKRAAELGISLAEYVRRALDHELGEPQDRGDVRGIIAVIDTGPNEVSANVHAHVGEATDALHRHDARG